MKWLPLTCLWLLAFPVHADITEGAHPGSDQIPPTALPRRDLSFPPSGNEIVCPGEYCRADGVFLTYETAFGSTEIIVDIAYEAALTDSVYMIVKDTTTRAQAISQLTAAGVDMDRVRFILYPALADNSIWVRDYGPVYIYEDGAKGIVDFWYPFTSDDNVPITIAATFGLPVYTNDLLHSGGNFISDGNGMCFATQIVYQYNPNYTQAQVRQIFEDYCGLDSLVVLPILDVENTKHIDVFCKLLDDETFIVGEYAEPSQGAGNNYYILNDVAAMLAEIQNLAGRPFEVVRIPMPPHEGAGLGVTRTYTNSLILNEKVLMPVYGISMDDEAAAVYQTLLPEHEIVPIWSAQIIHRAGAVHCITKLHHSDNPQIIFHEPLTTLPYGSAPEIRFRVNPMFTDMEATVHYRPADAVEFTALPAAFSSGEWGATLPTMTDDFHYFLSAMSTVGAVTRPRTAPDDYFYVAVSGGAKIAEGSAGEGLRLRAQSPFTTEIRITYSLGDRKSGSLVIFDALGRRVATFAPLSAGGGSVVWSASGCPAGTYFCRLQSADEVRTQRIMRMD